jgi:hypothetical protein
VSPQRLASLSTQLAELADSRRATDPADAARLSLAAYRIAPSAAAAHALIASFTPDSWVGLPGPTATYTGVAVSANGHLAAATDTSGHLRLWNITDPAHPTLAADIDANTADLTAARFLVQGGPALVTGGASAHTWGLTDPATPAVLSAFTGHITSPARLALSADGSLLATAASQDRTVELWDVRDPTHPNWLHYVDADGIVNDIALSPDGDTLAAAGENGSVTLWDVKDRGKPNLLSPVTGHTGPVNTVSFLRSGTRVELATGGDDTTVLLFDVTDPAHPSQLATLRGHNAGVTGLTAVGDGWLASTDASGALLGWDLSTVAGGTPVPTVLAAGTGPRDLAAGGATGNALLSVPAGGPGGNPALGSTDPARLVTIACATPANRISPAEWRGLIADLAYENPCSG